MDETGVVGRISVNPPEGITEDSFSEDNAPTLISLATLYGGPKVKKFILPQDLIGLERSVNNAIQRIALLHQNKCSRTRMDEFRSEKHSLKDHFDEIISNIQEDCSKNIENKEVYVDILKIVNNVQVKAMKIISKYETELDEMMTTIPHEGEESISTSTPAAGNQQRLEGMESPELSAIQAEETSTPATAVAMASGSGTRTLFNDLQDQDNIETGTRRKELKTQSQLQSEIDLINEKLEEATMEKENQKTIYEDKIATLQSKVDTLRRVNESSSNQGKITRLEQQVKELTEKETESNQNILIAQENIKKLEDQLNEKIAENQSLSQILGNESADDALTEELNNLREAMQKKINENSSIRNELGEKILENTNIRQVCADETEEVRKRYMGVIEKLEERIKDLRASNSTQREELESGAREQEENEAEISKLKEKIQEADRKRKELDETTTMDITLLTQKCTEKENEIKALQARLQTNDTIIRLLRETQAQGTRPVATETNSHQADSGEMVGARSSHGQAYEAELNKQREYAEYKNYFDGDSDSDQEPFVDEFQSEDITTQPMFIKSVRLREHINKFVIKNEEDLKNLPSRKISSEISHGQLGKMLEKYSEKVLSMEFQLIDARAKLTRAADRNRVSGEIQQLKSLQDELKEYKDSFDKVAEERNIRTEPKSSSAITGTPLKFSGEAVPYHFYEFVMAMNNYAQHSSVLEEDKGGLMLQYCEGAAKRYLDAEFPNNVNPNAREVIQKLETKYGNKNKIIEQLTEKHEEIGEIPDYTNDDYKSLNNIENKAEEHIYLMRKTKMLLDDGSNSLYLELYVNRVSGFLSLSERKEYAIKSLKLSLRAQLSLLSEYLDQIKCRAENRLSLREGPCSAGSGYNREHGGGRNDLEEETRSSGSSEEGFVGAGRYEGQQPRISYDHDRYKECKLCQLLPDAEPECIDTRHGFVGKNRTPCPGLCPLVRESNMESKIDALDGICRSCCQNYHDENHDETTCRYLENFPFLKCSERSCNIRKIFCNDHLKINRSELEKYALKYSTDGIEVIPY